MATLRSHTRIDRTPDEVWAVVSDAGAISDWFPGIEKSSAGALPVTSHLGTVDVLDDREDSLVVYSTEVQPDDLAQQLGPAIEDGLRGLKEHLERR